MPDTPESDPVREAPVLNQIAPVIDVVLPEVLVPADLGYPGAYPLPEASWDPALDAPSDTEWATQNRRINDLLMRGMEDGEGEGLTLGGGCL